MAVIRPFRYEGVTRGADDILRYDERPDSLVHMLRASVDRFPDNEALLETGGGPSVTYREFWEKSAQISGGLRSHGIRRGDRVAIRLPNGVNWCLAFFGIQMAGAIAVPVNTRFNKQEVAYVLTDSGSTYVFEPGAALPDSSPFVVEDLTEREISAIFYTSGTTGFPKGAMTTHENFFANANSSVRVSPFPLDSNTRTMVSVPLFHVTGCNSQFIVSCLVGGTAVIMPSFDVQAFLRAIGDNRVNALTSVPAIYWLAVNQPNFRDFDVSKVTRLSYGGAPIAPDLVLRIMEAFPNARVGNGFGLSETAAMSTFLPHEYSRLRPETVGFPTPVIEVRLAVSEDGSDVGELLIRGQNVVPGYWNKPEATAETFVDGWLHSGDIARIDAEGFVQIVDRKKDMVNRGGENVYCVEVENGLMGHPAVFDAAVMGVPDQVMGEKVGAVIVSRPGMTIDVPELLEFAAGVLGDFKIPQFVVIQKEPLPRNACGKVMKKTLRDSVQWGKQVHLRKTE